MKQDLLLYQEENYGQREVVSLFCPYCRVMEKAVVVKTDKDSKVVRFLDCENYYTVYDESEIVVENN